MKVLVDTHAFIWWNSAPGRLSTQVLALCQDRQNIILLSTASVWEMQIKIQSGKLHINDPLAEMVAGQEWNNYTQILPVTLNHVLDLQNLPLYHKDPFDRLLIAQARVEDAVLVSEDAM